MISDVIQHSSSDDLAPAAMRGADNDEQIIAMWLHGRSPHTQRAYRSDVTRFQVAIGKSLMAVTLGDLQDYSDCLGNSEISERFVHRALSSIKSLFGFAHRLGYLSFDTAEPIRLPGLKHDLSERILDEACVYRVIALEPNPRNHLILLVLYATGTRVSEIAGLEVKDCNKRSEGGQITVYGKGGKKRAILIPASVWREMACLFNASGSVFRSRKGGPLSAGQITRIARKAAERAGLTQKVTAHWLRHAHASHALDRQAPIHLVQQTLGHASVATTGRYLHARPDDSSSDYLSL